MLVFNRYTEKLYLLTYASASPKVMAIMASVFKRGKEARRLLSKQLQSDCRRTRSADFFRPKRRCSGCNLIPLKRNLHIISTPLCFCFCNDFVVVGEGKRICDGLGAENYESSFASRGITRCAYRGFKRLKCRCVVLLNHIIYNLPGKLFKNPCYN